MPPMTLGLESAHPPHCSTAARSARPLHITADVTYIRSLHVRPWSGSGSLWEVWSLVCSPLGMITLVYHKENSKCLKLSKFQKRSVAKKIHESLTTARTLDIYNPDSSIHCYFRLLASQPAREGGQSDVWLVGRSKTKVTFLLPLTLTDKRLVRAGRGCDCWGLPYCGKVVRTGLAMLHCLVAAQVESQQATSPGQDLTAPCWLCQNWFLIIVLWQFSKQESIKLHS